MKITKKLMLRAAMLSFFGLSVVMTSCASEEGHEEGTEATHEEHSEEAGEEHPAGTEHPTGTEHPN